MGKQKDRPPLADWEVRLLTGSTVVVAQAWHERVKHDYVFHDETGICYTFPVRTVAWIGRDAVREIPWVQFAENHPDLTPEEIRDLRGVFERGQDYSEAVRDEIAAHVADPNGDYSEAAR